MDNLSAQRFTVSPDDAGKRLDVFLSQCIKELSRTRIQKLIAAGSVLVNGHYPHKRLLVLIGDAIEVRETASVRPLSSLLEPQNIPLAILYEDEFVLAIDKPAGLVVHPGNGNWTGTLVNALLYRNGALAAGYSPERPGLVHRLDKETSGVLLVAKTDPAHSSLARAFASRAIKKRYVGFCFGVPQDPHGIIDIALARSRKEPVKRIADKAGKSSQTEYHVLGSRAGISFIQFLPHTGRTHQIRVHCSVSGFPIVADSLYGGGKERLQRLAPLDRPFASSILHCFNRHALHARSITFINPFTQKEMTIVAPLPEDFQSGLRLFGKESIGVTLV
jgi:23S rRNA pseudouridine1911/1915/1917 synthase